MASDADRVRDVRFVRTCGERLGLTDEVIESAARCYHRLQGTPLAGEVDPALLGISLVYLAAKSADTPRDLRDCITVGVAAADPGTPAPIPIDEAYRELRGSLIAAEQLVLRALRFDVVGDGDDAALHSLPPRRLLLLFLYSLERDLPDGAATPESFARFARACCAVLNDAAHSACAASLPADRLAAGAMCVAAAVEGVPPVAWVEEYAGVLAPALRDRDALAAAIAPLVDLYESPQLCREALAAP